MDNVISCPSQLSTLHFHTIFTPFPTMFTPFSRRFHTVFSYISHTFYMVLKLGIRYPTAIHNFANGNTSSYSSCVTVIPYRPLPLDHEHIYIGQSTVEKWFACKSPASCVSVHHIPIYHAHAVEVRYISIVFVSISRMTYL